MKRFLICSLLLAAIGLPVAAQYKVAVIGSSTAGGTGAHPADSAWVPLFDQYYKQKLGLVDSTYTFAIGGYPVYKGMPAGYAPPFNRPGPDTGRNVSKANRVLCDLPLMAQGIVIVNYPTNGFETYGIGEIMFCLQTIYDSVVKAGHRCYIITSQPRTGGAFDAPEVKRRLAVIKDSIIQRFGASNTINFYDGLYNIADSSLLEKYSAGDGIHFNNAGHRELFERVKAKNLFSKPIPFQLRQFSGNTMTNNISLEWTAEISDTTLFIVQRSSDGKHFTDLLQLPASSTTHQYAATDPDPLPGRSHYRLLIRTGGDDYLSNTIQLHHPSVGLVLNKLYPNPATAPILVAELTALQNYSGLVSITSCSGLSFMQKATNFKKGDLQLWLPVDFLPKGQFILSIMYGEGQSILRSFSK